MKAFSKEWWLDKGLIFEIGVHFYRSDAQQAKLAMFCFKRYAEAYHLEQMEEYDLDCAMIAERNERERILGIIEQLSFYDDIEKAHILIEMELIEKIKG